MLSASLPSGQFIPLASPDIRPDDIAEVVEVLASGKLVQGEKVDLFEKNLERYLGVKHCIAVSSGTATLHLILVALGIGRGDEVVVPAFSYIATANVVELVGATPVFVDIEIDTFNINPALIEEKLTPRTKAVMIVHEFGLSADSSAIKSLCDQRGLCLIEDAACALGAKDGDAYAGITGIAGSFSFHPRKAITSGEGGVITTHDTELARTLRALRNHGIDPNTTAGFEFTHAGFNYRMTDFQAALVNSQLARFDEILARKRVIADEYLGQISSSKVTLPKTPPNKLHTWQTFHLLLSDALDQKKTMDGLKDQGIGSNYGAQCMPAQKFFANKYRHDCEAEFPNAMRAYRQGLAIPLYEKLTNEQVRYVINQINRL
jgi:perosamine synthetase